MANDNSTTVASIAEQEVKPSVAGNELKSKILQQVEYYFDDINLPRDKFLQAEMKTDHGWIPLDLLLKFNRLVKLTTDKEKIADALADSNLIELSDDKTKIRRNPEIPMPENTLEYWQEIKTRTVYVKGFPLETTLDEIMEFVRQGGDVKNVLMRRTKLQPRTFKGSIFVTFSDVASAKEFADNGSLSSFKDQPLTKMMQEAYWANKKKEQLEKRTQEKAIKQAKKQQTIKNTKQSREGASFVKGSVLKLSGFDEAEQDSLVIKDFFSAFGDVGYVGQPTNGEATLRVRSKEENKAQSFWDTVLEKTGSSDGKVDYKGQKLTARVLDDEEEQKYWIEFTKVKVASDERFQKREPRKKNRRDDKGGKLKEAKKHENTPRGAKRIAEGETADLESQTKKSKRTVFKDEGDDDADDTTSVKDDTTSVKDEAATQE